MERLPVLIVQTLSYLEQIFIKIKQFNNEKYEEKFCSMRILAKDDGNFITFGMNEKEKKLNVFF